MQLYTQGEFDRAIRMFELAQTLPGAGMDYKRESSSGMIGSAGAPPNPRGLKKERFATAQQKLIAQYNIACCHAALGDERRALEILRGYISQVREPLEAVNEMLADADLVPVRAGLREMRDEIKRGQSKAQGLFGLGSFTNPLKAVADSVGVEWKD